MPSIAARLDAGKPINMLITKPMRGKRSIIEEALISSVGESMALLMLRNATADRGSSMPGSVEMSTLLIEINRLGCALCGLAFIALLLPADCRHSRRRSFLGLL